MNFKPGDLVSVDTNGKESQTGIIISEGHPVSIYVEDRPIRSISAMSYGVILNGVRRSIYDYEILEIMNSGQCNV